MPFDSIIALHQQTPLLSPLSPVPDPRLSSLPRSASSAACDAYAAYLGPEKHRAYCRFHKRTDTDGTFGWEGLPQERRFITMLVQLSSKHTTVFSIKTVSKQ